VTKKADLLQYRDAVEIQMMRALKQALDPQNILNPGKVI
jgi:D-lactate dehydrogenase (cytochrome)